MHKAHTKSCKKYGAGCRFNFPKPPSTKTIIGKSIDDLFPDLTEQEKNEKLEHAKSVLTVVNKALRDLGLGVNEDDHIYDNNLQKFLDEKCGGICSVDEYMSLLQISTSGRVVILKREVSERNVNNFNPTFQYIWNANTDIQKSS